MMQPADIRKAIGAARAACGAYHERPDGAQECLRLDLAASNIAAFFERPGDSPWLLRCLALQAAVQARALVKCLRSAARQARDAIPLSHAVAGWEAALLELERELDSIARSARSRHP